MKKYKVSNSELGYEQIIMAENEQEAEIDGLKCTVKNIYKNT
jgi:hypothetical protein